MERGANMSIFCATCGHAMRARARFCQHCGGLAGRPAGARLLIVIVKRGRALDLAAVLGALIVVRLSFALNPEQRMYLLLVAGAGSVQPDVARAVARW